MKDDHGLYERLTWLRLEQMPASSTPLLDVGEIVGWGIVALLLACAVYLA